MALSRYSELCCTRAVLREQYRAACDAYQWAKSPEVRAHHAALAAVAISELQHPSLQDLDDAPTR